ncbi:MAG: hypothetical protein ACFFC7_14645 [Candidatus Hermodarchaeota archaeon]
MVDQDKLKELTKEILLDIFPEDELVEFDEEWDEIDEDYEFPEKKMPIIPLLPPIWIPITISVVKMVAEVFFAESIVLTASVAISLGIDWIKDQLKKKRKKEVLSKEEEELVQRIADAVYERLQKQENNKSTSK